MTDNKTKRLSIQSFTRKLGHIMLTMTSILLVGILILVAVLEFWSYPGTPKPFLDENGKPLRGSVSEKIFVDINGVKQGMFIKSKNINNPIMLYLHGGPGLDHTSLLPLQPLADQFTLIFYDHRCNGRSEGADVSSMTWENLTADAECLRQALGFDKWAVLGHSFGGNVALEYALRYPQSLSHLILMDTGGDARWPQHHAAEILAKQGYSATAVQATRRFFNGQLTPSEFMTTAMKFMRAYFYRNYFLMMAHEVFSPGLKPKMRPEPLIFANSQLLPGWTVMHRLGELKVPTLVMSGRQDFLYPPECEALLANGIANAQLEIIEFASHNPQMERTVEVIQIIRRFMASADPSYAGATFRSMTENEKVKNIEH